MIFRASGQIQEPYSWQKCIGSISFLISSGPPRPLRHLRCHFRYPSSTLLTGVNFSELKSGRGNDNSEQSGSTSHSECSQSHNLVGFVALSFWRHCIVSLVWKRRFPFRHFLKVFPVFHHKWLDWLYTRENHCTFLTDDDITVFDFRVV